MFIDKLSLLSHAEKNQGKPVTRVTTHQQKKDLFLNTPASSC